MILHVGEDSVSAELFAQRLQNIMSLMAFFTAGKGKVGPCTLLGFLEVYADDVPSWVEFFEEVSQVDLHVFFVDLLHVWRSPSRKAYWTLLSLTSKE